MQIDELKEVLRKPIFYMILVPILAGGWALYARFLEVPRANETLTKQYEIFEESYKYMGQILELAPERLEFAKEAGEGAEFDYMAQIQDFANQWGIESSSYSLQTNKPIKKKGKRSQSANMTINDVSIETFSQFFSTLLIRWPGLQCEQLKLARTNAGLDTWKINMKLTYLY